MGSRKLGNENGEVSLEGFDHGVLPPNDLGRTFRFWSPFMGARLGFHVNLNVRGLNREVPMNFFTRRIGAGARRRADNDDCAGIGQLFIVRKVAQVAERSRQCFKGPHIDLRVAEESHQIILKRFDRRETYLGPDPNLIPWHEPDSNPVRLRFLRQPYSDRNNRQSTDALR